MTQQPNLIPRAPRRILQPRKDEIRRRLEVSEAQAAFDSTPRWWRLWRRIWVRLVEVDPPALRVTIKAVGIVRYGSNATAPAGHKPAPPPNPPPPQTLPGIAP